MAKVKWTPQALSDIESISEYISRDSVFYAQRYVRRIFERTKILLKFPRSGRIVPEFNDPVIREVIHGSHRIVYRILETHIDIVTVHHSAIPMEMSPAFLKN
ncbi:MAG: type II toxin-antitoxin system RelE/ParE family toxin [Bacteroidota bacterium]|jgi:plasmid stabilization system protein ParE